MARASTPTLLALDRFAMIFGINPAHFNSAAGVADSPMPIGGACTDLWFQESWQSNDRVSREDIALEIANAEEDIAREVGFWPGPKWVDDEIHRYPRHHRRDVYAGGFNVRGMRKSIITEYSKIIDMGQRATTTIGTATTGGGTLVFSDPDGDGFNETATITLPLPAALTAVDTCEVKTYFDGESTLDWEIRPPRSVTIVGANIVIVFWSWQLIDPDLWEAFPTTGSGLDTLNLAGTIYVATVDVYREFNDTTAQSAEFFWEPDPANVITRILCSSCGGTGCAACALTTQDGCVRIRDVHAGIVVPEPANYDTDEAAWESQAWTECREPDQVKVWYYAGDLDQRFLAGRSCEALSQFWAQTIAWLAVARLERELCSCAARTNLVRKLRTDASFSSREGGSYTLTDSDLGNPFGTLIGEIRAWRRVSKVVGLKAKAAVLP